MRLDYCEQPHPEGLAQAFILGRDFLAGGPACLVLGDNILYGHGLSELLQRSSRLEHGARIFGYWVRDPRSYGVVEFDRRGRAISLEEKPTEPRSNYAVPGLYFYGSDVCDLAAGLAPSARGELEITDLNRLYLERGELQVELLGRGYAWLDAGTHRSLIEASSFIQAIEERQGLKVGCLQEIAWRNGWITTEVFKQEIEAAGSSSYGSYLREALERVEREHAAD
jgi:glucose-1-phosphate thymidylyltransferase